MTVNREKMLNLLKSLAQRKIEAGCTEAEALEASEKLAELMDRYGFDQADLNESERDREPIGKGGQTMPNAHYHKLQYVTVAVGEYCDVKVWSQRNPDGTVTLSLFGRHSDVTLAKYLFDIFRGAADRGWEEYFRTTQVSMREQRSYFMGMMGRISNRLREMKAARNAHTDNITGRTGNELVVAKNELVEAGFATLGLKLRKSSSKPKVKLDSYREGQRAGDKVHIGTGIGADVREKRRKG